MRQVTDYLPIGDWIVQLSPILSYPRKAIVELTMECNLNCIYCFRRTCNETFGVMSEKVFSRVLSELKHSGVKRIIFTGWGEPLTHPKVLEYLSMAKNAGFNIVLNTNGTLLETFAEDIVKIGVDEVVVSIDAVDESIYGKLRYPGTVSKVLRGLQELYKAQKRQDKVILLGLEFTTTTLNYTQLPKIITLATNVKAVYIRLSNIIPINKEMEEYACFMNDQCRKEIMKYIDIVSKLVLEYPVRLFKVNFELKAQRTCPIVSDNCLFVGWDGKISPCLHYGHSYQTYLYGIRRRINRIIFGDVMKDSLISIWHRKDYHSFRFMARTGYLPSCLDCEVAEYCVFTENNLMDCWGRSPTCAHCPFIYGLSACPL